MRISQLKRQNTTLRARFSRRVLGCVMAAASCLCAGITPQTTFSQTPATSAAQPAPTPLPQRPRRVETDDGNILASDEVVRVDTDLVTVELSITDAKGEPVRNLRPEDFKLYEDGAEKPVSFFNIERRAGEPRPVAVAFALDVSGSVTPEELARLRIALQSFVDRLADGKSVFAVMTFGMNIRTLQGFTGETEKLNRAFAKLEGEAGGLSTHTYDAIDDAVRLLVRKAPRTRDQRLLKRSVIVITDGFPVGDTVAPATVIERARAADVSVYTVTLPSYSRLLASSGRKPLPTPLDVSGVTELTGGANVYATDRDFTPLFRALAEEVNSTYILSFYPAEEKRRDGRFHSLRVEVPQGLNLRANRAGYQSPR